MFLLSGELTLDDLSTENKLYDYYSFINKQCDENVNKKINLILSYY